MSSSSSSSSSADEGEFLSHKRSRPDEHEKENSKASEIHVDQQRDHDDIQIESQEESHRKPSAKLLKTNVSQRCDEAKLLPSNFLILRKLTCNYSDVRRTNDEIHSSIEFGPVFKCIIDTPQFQRLRGLKQLGTAEFVYCNATHNRFEHSLGVAHLAKLFCERIRHKQPGLRCTAKDVLCVELAGLCHDIGHGPFSHIFECFVHEHTEALKKSGGSAQMARARRIYEENKDGWPSIPPNWTHENASLMMLNAALAHLGLAVNPRRLDAPLRQIGDGIDARSMRVFDPSNFREEDDSNILTSRDLVFIQECITGAPLPEVEALHGPGFHGRPAEHQEWMYDIVHNRHSGLDVDKIDYYARDQRRANKESGEIDKVMVEDAIVAWAPCTKPEGSCSTCAHRHRHRNMHLMICYPEKRLSSCAEFFKTRNRLHTTIYQHKTTDAAALMVTDILRLADPYFLVPTLLPSEEVAAASNSSNTGLPLSRVMCHPGAYLRMKDTIIDQISMTTDPDLAEARKLIWRLQCRDLYKCIASKRLQCHSNEIHRKIRDMDESDIIDGMINVRGRHEDLELTADDLVVVKRKIHHGLNDKNPLSKLRLVERAKLDKVTASNYHDLPEADPVDEDMCDMPRVLESVNLRVYCRDPAKCNLASHVFSQYWNEELQAEMALTAGPTSNINMLTQDSDDDADDWNDHDDGRFNRNYRSPLPHPNDDDDGTTPKSITPVRHNRLYASDT